MRTLTFTFASRIGRMFMAAAIILLFQGCDFDLGGDSAPDKTVDVNVKITLTNGTTKDAYLIITDLYEQNGPSTLVKPGASRIVMYGMNVLNSPGFEHKFDFMIRGESEQGTAIYVHTVDYKKYSISVDDEDPNLAYSSINVGAVFTGNSFTVTESQGS
jgi:hypothetical protein